VEQQEHRRIALLGITRNTDNYGVRVLLSSAVEVLSATEPEAEIFLLDYGRMPEVWKEMTSGGERQISLVNLPLSWRLYLPNNVFRLIALVVFLRTIPIKGWRLRLLGRNPWLRQVIGAATHYSVAGGDSFSDIYGLKRFLYVTLPQVLVLLLQKPLVLLPQTYGPFSGCLSRFLARWILCRAKVIYSRDMAGITMIRDLVGSNLPNVQVVPDMGFCMTPEPLDREITKNIENFRLQGPIVGLNISSLLYIGGYTGNNMFGLREPFPVLVETLLKHITQVLMAQVLLVPHVCGGQLSEEDETRLCRRLEREFNQHLGKRLYYLNHDLNHRQMKSVIGLCDFFIGARMHACISAVSQGVPCICLSYSPKFAGVMSPLGGVQVVDLRKAMIPEVLKTVEEGFYAREQSRYKLRETIKVIQGKLHLLTERPLNGSII